MSDYAATVQQQSITVHFKNGDAFVWPASHPNFNEVRDALKARAPGETIRKLMDVVGRMAETVAAVPSRVAGNITVSREGVFYKGEPLHLSICDRMIAHAAEGFDIEPMIKFLEKLLRNPRREAVLSLYDFMAANDIPIWEDGDFIVYKKVGVNYMDIYSGRFDNSIGQSPRVEPWQVEADREQTCAQGLHVCSRKYLPHYGGGNARAMICKVNPADVVAVPRDYNNAKMRVCGYEVIGELNDVQKAEIFDAHRVVAPTEANKEYVTWADDIDTDDDECYDCGWSNDDCRCDLDSPYDPDDERDDPVAPDEPEPETPPPAKKSWFNW